MSIEITPSNSKPPVEIRPSSGGKPVEITKPSTKPDHA